MALRAGPLSLVYEAGDLRYIGLGEQEMLRRVYVAMPIAIGHRAAQVHQHADRAFRKTHSRSPTTRNTRQGEIDFAWRGTITGDAQGTNRRPMEGKARSTFMRNRIGFCVLHPGHECAASACLREEVDGTVE